MTRVFTLVALTGCLWMTPAWAGGKTYSTNASGLAVNQNQFTAKSDVYIAGGPQNANSAGLTDGLYYFQVTDPNGATLLSTDNAVCREVNVVNGRVAGATGPCPHADGSTNPSNGATSVQLIPFNDTPNAGGVYKIWLLPSTCATINSLDAKVLDFSGGCGNTDNFQIGAVNCDPNCPPPAQALLSGLKFYDGNRDGLYDSVNEAGVNGVTIKVTGNAFTTITTVTSNGGLWSASVPMFASFTVCEDTTVAPFTTGLWEQTAPAGNNGCYSGTADSDVPGLNFGNVAKVAGAKYYDPNTNGIVDNGEVTIDGFKIVYCTDGGCTFPQITSNTFTANGGKYSFYLPTQNSSYQICETAPNSNWKQTAPLNPPCFFGSGPAGSKNFLNVCLGHGGGLSKGFWTNRNGQTLFNTNTAGNLNLLVSLNLKNSDGSDFNPATYAAFSAWLGSASATNMANMLSAQLAAMELNVFNGKVNGNSLIYAPGSLSANAAGFATVNAIMNEANTELGLHGSTPAGSPYRSYQETLKNILDAGDNDTNFVQQQPCPFTTPY